MSFSLGLARPAASLTPQLLPLEFQGCRWRLRHLRVFSPRPPFFHVPSSPNKGITSESPLGRGPEAPIPPLSWSQVDRRLEGRPKPRNSHQLCLAQFGGVTSILCVLEDHEDRGPSLRDCVKKAGIDRQLSDTRGLGQSHIRSPRPSFWLLVTTSSPDGILCVLKLLPPCLAQPSPALPCPALPCPLVGLS